MKELCYHWRCEKEYSIHSCRHSYIKRKDGIVILLVYPLSVHEPLRETGALKVGSNGGEDG